MELTHASWFSGVGGLDLGLERAGWRTVSFSEIEPYPCAVLGLRWPEVPQLGDILTVGDRADAAGGGPEEPRRGPGGDGASDLGGTWRSATLWSGGFPCQDLSVAGRRRGFEGDRSSLAFTFLDLVERYRPPAILLENVPGLLTSHAGRDMARLLGEVAELGYGVAYRSLDAQYFGVPQRRLRVFIVGLRSGQDDPDGHLAALRAAEVLAVGCRCGRHPPKGGKARAATAPGARTGLEIAGGLTRRYGKGVNTTLDDGAVVLNAVTAGVGRVGSRGADDGANIVLGQTPDAGRDGAPDGPAGRLDPRPRVAFYVSPEANQGADLEAREVEIAPAVTATEGERATDRGIRVVTPFVKVTRPHGPDDDERWAEQALAPTVNAFDVGDVRATTLLAPTVNSNKTGGWRFDADQAESLVESLRVGGEDPLLPLGLDSNRYRACGNAVVTNVAEWLGHRLRHALEEI